MRMHQPRQGNCWREHWQGQLPACALASIIPSNERVESVSTALQLPDQMASKQATTAEQRQKQSSSLAGGASSSSRQQQR